MIGKLDDVARQHAIFTLIVIHSTFSVFLNASWSSGFLTRMLLHIPIATLCIIERRTYNEEMSLAFSWVSGLTVASVLELSVYVNMKAKARLFLKTKQSK